MWMTKYGQENSGIESVPQAGQEGEEYEKGEIKDEENDRDYSQPVSIVR